MPARGSLRGSAKWGLGGRWMRECTDSRYIPRMAQGDTPSSVRPLPSWVPAGWYPDPLKQGAARRWDGKRWTLEYRDTPPPQPIPASPSEVSATAPLAPGAAAASARGPNEGKFGWWKEIPMAARVVIVAVVLIVIIAIANSGSGGKTKATNASAGAGAVPTTPTPSTPAAAPVALKLDTGDYSVTSSHTTLHGTATKGATVTVEGHHADVHGTHWSKTVALGIGENSMAVEASLAGHEPATQTISVTRHHSQAEIEAKQRAAEEAQHRRERKAAEEVERYKAEAVTIPYSHLNKNPEEYVGKIVKYRGQIFQIQENGGEGGIMLLAVDEEYEIWSDNIWVNYDKHINAAEKDIVTVYGEITGQKEYKTQIGGETYVPEMKAKYIEE
jgi:hypothetical protein